jgi:hypothetical protein
MSKDTERYINIPVEGMITKKVRGTAFVEPSLNDLCTRGMGVRLWGDLPSPKAAARQEVPCTRTSGVHANGYYQKYELKTSRRSRESGGVSARVLPDIRRYGRD